MEHQANSFAGSKMQEEAGTDLDDLQRYRLADKHQREGERLLENAACELQELEESESVHLFHRQLDLLKRRLLNNPKAFQQIFMEEGKT